MSNQSTPWKTILLLVVWMILIEFGLVCFAIALPDLSVLFIVLAAAVFLFVLIRCRKVLLGDHASGSTQTGSTQTATGEYTRIQPQSHTVVGTSGGLGEKVMYFKALQAIGKDCAFKAQQHRHANYASVQELCEKLQAYAGKRGVQLTKESVENLLMAMTFSRCIFVKKTSENTEDFLSIVGEFFSGLQCPCEQLSSVPSRPSGLLYKYQDNELTETDLFKRLYGLSFFENTTCVCALKNIVDINWGQTFTTFITHFKNPHGDTTIALPQVVADNMPYCKDKKFVIPSNVWFFILLSGEEQPLPQDASLWSSTIELNGVGSKLEATASEVTAVAHSQLSELIESSFDEHFLPLDTWKKLDKVEEYLNASISFKIDNILARQIERITTIHVACGGSHVSAMDKAIAHCILPLLSGYTREQIDREGTTLKELVDGLFGAENIPEIHQALCAVQLD